MLKVIVNMGLSLASMLSELAYGMSDLKYIKCQKKVSSLLQVCCSRTVVN